MHLLSATEIPVVSTSLRLSMLPPNHRAWPCLCHRNPPTRWGHGKIWDANVVANSNVWLMFGKLLGGKR